MSSLDKNLKELQTRYRRIWDKVKNVNEHPVKGSLIITKKKRRNCFYIQKRDELSGDYERFYLAKDQMDLARSLAQKSYDKKVHNLIKKRLIQLSKLTRDFKDDEVDHLYNELDEARRTLIDPVEIPFNEVVENWVTQKYVKKSFQDATRTRRDARACYGRSCTLRDGDCSFSCCLLKLIR